MKNEGKCEGKLSPLTLVLTPKSVYNPPCPVKVQSKSKENQNLNQKEKIKKRIVFVQRNAFLLVFKALHTSYFAKMHKINVSTLLKCIKLAFLFC